MKIFFLVILVLLVGCSSISKKNILSKDYSKARRIIVLIHGIGGSYRHFGHLRESLERHLTILDKEFCNEVVHFDYQTGNNQLTTVDFAGHLARFLKGYLLQTAPLKTSDKISFVMHSQGGLVGNIWLLNTIRGLNGYSQKYLNHMDSMITLSTPFWGANIANIAKKVYGYNYLPYGKKELEEMTFGSDTIGGMRKGFIKYGDLFRKYGIRFLNIGGRSFEGSENDTLVAFPSTNQNFIYLPVGITPPIGRKSYKKMNLADFSLVDAIHLNLLALFFDVESFAGISQAFKSCTQRIDCNHPSFNQILKFIRNEKMTRFVMGNKGDFFMDIEIKSNLNRDQIVFHFNTPKPELVQIKNRKPRDDYKMVSKGVHRFHFEGNILDNDERERLLSFQVIVPGYRPLEVTALLQAGMTSYIPLSLPE